MLFASHRSGKYMENYALVCSGEGVEEGLGAQSTPHPASPFGHTILYGQPLYPNPPFSFSPSLLAVFFPLNHRSWPMLSPF